VGQRAGRKGVGPGAFRFAKLEDATLATVDDLIEQAEQSPSIDRLVAGRLWGRPGAAFALGEELHARPNI